MTLILLGLILAVLLILVGGRRGVKTIATLTLNILIYFAMAGLILRGINPIPAAVLACMAICAVSLFFNCGVNAKSFASFGSVVVVVLLMWALVELFGRGARIEGFSPMQLDQIEGYSWIVNINMSDLAVACILIGLIGAIIDTAIAVSSAQFEVVYNNPRISFAGLYLSGLKVGRDVLGTTCNTLYFAFLGGYATLIIWYVYVEWTFGAVINSEVFVDVFIRSVSSAFGCVLIMPITALFTTILLRTGLNRKLRRLEQRLSVLRRRLP